MNNKSKIAQVIAVVLIIISIFSKNDFIMALSVFACFFFLTTSKVLEQLHRAKHIKEIENSNVDYITVKENNKWMILLIIVMALNFSNAMGIRFDMYKTDTPNPSDNIIVFLNSLDSSEKLLILVMLMFVILAIITIYQVLFNQTIVSHNKIIFYDGIVFEASDIDDIEYDKWSISKKKKAIKVAKGFYDRKILVDLEDFDKVKAFISS